jgi:hypothetical protein
MFNIKRKNDEPDRVTEQLPKTEKWYLIDETWVKNELNTSTYKMAIRGGWLYKTTSVFFKGDRITSNETVCFVPSKG